MQYVIITMIMTRTIYVLCRNNAIMRTIPILHKAKCMNTIIAWDMQCVIITMKVLNMIYA